ncbi:prolyl oligopeptidase family serine peptidase [Methyloligella sp. 2.7D]|uniref:S9 family peptidase n=1 Tax=unclassified Methyloligella TaxID=2625955 RepID=UPI00157CA24E|nr:prolyl oligopeptidase family serine peptidase [Methyloligella sp. GL2]QKP76283.1 S9 family peptidase [Methyloligella sp. GL2]
MSLPMASPARKRLLSIEDILSLHGFEGYFGPQFDVSPCGSALAICCQRGLRDAPVFGVPFLVGGERGELWIVDRDREKPRRIEAPDGIGVFSPRWSADGNCIALAATDGTRFVRPAIVDVGAATMRILPTANLALQPAKPPLGWLSSQKIACEVLPDGELPFVLETEWHGDAEQAAHWRAARDGSRSTISQIQSGDEMAAYPAGSPAVINVDTGEVQCFSHQKDLPKELECFAGREIVPYPPTLVSGVAGVSDDSALALDITDRGDQIFVSRDDDATRVIWLRDGSAETAFETDHHLSDVQSGAIHRFEVTHPELGTAKTSVILPPCAGPDERLPALFWVYPNAQLPAAMYDKPNGLGPFNLHRFAAMGFAVVRPEVPFDDQIVEQRGAADVVVEWITAAADAVAAAGCIDRERMQVAGHSFGGWATLTLLAKTDLFRSGIAVAGAYDLISAHGTFDARSRHRSDPIDGGSLIEKVWHLPGPPWDHLDAYAQNSPLSGVESISAPVLLMHGDRDYVPMSQAEEMFSALRRLGRDVSFARLWGEGHVACNPETIREMDRLMEDWLRRHRDEPNVAS